MKKERKQIEFEIVINTLNERGYGIGKMTLYNTSYNVFILGVLPGETVKAVSFKKKRGCIFAHAIEIIKPSPYRVQPKECDHYFACSPWQIMQDSYELEIKQKLIQTCFKNDASYNLNVVPIAPSPSLWGYRNKVEFGFYEDWETGHISLSYFKREGNKGKYPIHACQLLPNHVNEVAQAVVATLNAHKVSSKLLKYLLIRYSFYEQKVYIQLFVKDKETFFTENTDFSIIFGQIMHSDTVASFDIFYSNPQSPASVYTQKLFKYGNNTLREKLDNKVFLYTHSQFFQINPPAFELLLSNLNQWIQENNTSYNINRLPLIDMYCGVGTIGLSLGHHFTQLIGVEIGEGTLEMCIRNAKNNNMVHAQFYQQPAEKALEHIIRESCVIVDPPRIGLHTDVVHALLSIGPEILMYISCNPATQARDFNLLQSQYTLVYNKAYNFYPHTPHVEHVIILVRTKCVEDGNTNQFSP